MATSLDRRQAEDFIRKVDDELYQQRRKLLALDTPLTVLLPQHLQGLSKPLVADYIADRLLFSLTAFSGRTAALRRAKYWLEGCVSYLFHCCPPKERTFYYLLKLTELPHGTRFELFEGHRSADDPIRSDEDMPRILKGLEVVCVMAISEAGKLRNAVK